MLGNDEEREQRIQITDEEKKELTFDELKFVKVSEFPFNNLRKLEENWFTSELLTQEYKGNKSLGRKGILFLFLLISFTPHPKIVCDVLQVCFCNIRILKKITSIFFFYLTPSHNVFFVLIGIPIS